MAIPDTLNRLVNRFNGLLGSKGMPDDPRLQAIYQTYKEYATKQILSQSIEDTRFVILDTETTGFQVYAGDEMISIAMLEYQGLSPTGREYTQFINPGRPIPAETTAIHGIHDEDVADSPVIKDVLPDIAEFIGNGVLVGHHIQFDQRFLNKYIKRQIGCQMRNVLLDTMLLFTSHTKRMGHYTLDEVADYCKYKPTERHTALGDALAAAAIFKCMISNLCKPDDTVKYVYNLQFDTDEESHSSPG